MRTALQMSGALLGLILMAGCAETPKPVLSFTKYEPMKTYNAPFEKVFAAAKQAMAADNYKLEVDVSNPKEGSGMLVTGYITTESTAHFYTDDKAQKKPCQVKYLIHADLRTLEDGRTMIDLRIPESTELHKPNIGAVWEKTDTMAWRGRKVQDAIAATLAGKVAPPPAAPAPAAPKPEEKKEKK